MSCAYLGEQNRNGQSCAWSYRVGVRLGNPSGYRTGENPARWKGHLENLLATISKSSRTKNLPFLPWQRIGAFMSALRTRDGASARAVKFAILTACRPGEVRGARWAEFDMAGKLWTIPAEHMKAKREHQVPLSDAALALLESMLKDDDAEVVFAGTKGQPLSDMSLTAVIRCMNVHEKPIWTDANGAAPRCMDSAAHSACGQQRARTTRVRLPTRTGAPVAGCGRVYLSARFAVRQACRIDGGVGRVLRDGADRCGGQTDMRRGLIP